MEKIKLIFFVAVFFTSMVSVAQKPDLTRKSPPAQITEKVGLTSITIDYSRPSKRGRTIFGELEQFGKVWRTGANETTWIEIDQDVEVEGQPLEAGKYGLFTIPGAKEWIIIFNEKWDGWGAYEYNISDDVLRVKVMPETLEEEVELLTIEISELGVVSISWDRTKVQFSVR